MKVCIACKSQKPFEEFHKSKRNRDGRRGKCKPCHNEAARKYNAANREKVREISKRSDKKNRYKYKERVLLWEQRNKEKRQEQARIWRSNNKDKVCNYLATRRALKKETSKYQTRLEKFMIESLYWISRVLSNSCKENFEVDHITPLSRGGSHSFDNLQILTATENRRKYNKANAL